MLLFIVHRLLLDLKKIQQTYRAKVGLTQYNHIVLVVSLSILSTYRFIDYDTFSQTCFSFTHNLIKFVSNMINTNLSFDMKPFK